MFKGKAIFCASPSLPISSSTNKPSEFVGRAAPLLICYRLKKNAKNLDGDLLDFSWKWKVLNFKTLQKKLYIVELLYPSKINKV